MIAAPAPRTPTLHILPSGDRACYRSEALDAETNGAKAAGLIDPNDDLAILLAQREARLADQMDRQARVRVLLSDFYF